MVERTDTKYNDGYMDKKGMSRVSLVGLNPIAALLILWQRGGM